MLDEVSLGDPEAAKNRLDVVAPLPVLPITDEVMELAPELIGEGMMPREALQDAAHVATAAVHQMDILLTWNCRHIANAVILRDVCGKLRQLGYEPPTICTPDEMLGEF